MGASLSRLRIPARKELGPRTVFKAAGQVIDTRPSNDVRRWLLPVRALPPPCCSKGDRLGPNTSTRPAPAPRPCPPCPFRPPIPLCCTSLGHPTYVCPRSIHTCCLPYSHKNKVKRTRAARSRGMRLAEGLPDRTPPCDWSPSHHALQSPQIRLSLTAPRLSSSDLALDRYNTVMLRCMLPAMGSQSGDSPCPFGT